uniref:Uncharacterized protein n=1 Tax=Acrobeloides nanus TaxID=290746 RepID=A0A914E4T2_9BILA
MEIKVQFKVINDDHTEIPYTTIEYSKKYCVVYNYLTANDTYLKGDHITLVLHSTINYASLLEEHINQWDGGISAAFFVSTPRLTPNSTIAVPSLLLQSTIAVVNQLRMYEGADKLSIHLFFEKGSFKKCPQVYLRPLDMEPE